LDPPESISQTASRTVQPLFAQLAAECPRPAMSWAGIPPSKLPVRMARSEPSSTTHGSNLANPSPRPKRHLDRFSRFCSAYDRERPTDRPICNSWSHLYV